MRKLIFFVVLLLAPDSTQAAEGRRCDRTVPSSAGFSVGQKVVNDYFPRQWRLTKIQCFSSDGFAGMDGNFYHPHYLQRLVKKLGAVSVGDRVILMVRGRASMLQVQFITEGGKFFLSDGKWHDAFRIHRFPGQK